MYYNLPGFLAVNHPDRLNICCILDGEGHILAEIIFLQGFYLMQLICLSDFELTGYFVWFAVSRPCRYDDITRTVENLKLNSCEGIALFVYLDNLNPCG